MKLPPEDCENCYKGISRADLLFGEGVNASVFFDAKRVPELDGWDGSSVNWDLIHGGAHKELLDRPGEDGLPRFKIGTIKIPREAIDDIRKRYGYHNLAYELREENTNIYHGHILFSSSLEKVDRYTIFGALVYEAKFEPR